MKTSHAPPEQLSPPCRDSPASFFIVQSGAEFSPARSERLPDLARGGRPEGQQRVDALRDWWHTFNDPVLNELVERAHRGNLSLRIAAVRVLEARAQLGIAIGRFYPQTQQAVGSLQYNRISQGSSQGAFFQQSASGQGGAAASGASFPSSYWQSQAGFTAAWELDFWGRYRRAIESADAVFLATVADYDNALVTLTADTANFYIQVRTLQARVQIARENAASQQESLNIAEARFRYGVASQLDVEQARTFLYNTAALVPPLEIQLRQAKDALSVLLGLPPSELSDILGAPAPIPVSPPQVVL
ncbi:MAG TPA: TolC family protein, partial [Thermodesulfobacteriota bacterium]|nr:TolC family protein [Thermodesulfobacteriota bacterium]